MDYEVFASDLPQEGTVVFRSVEETQEATQRLGVNQEMRQLGKGPFRCDMAVRITEQAKLFSHRSSKACSIYLEPPQGAVALLFLRSPRGPILASGHNVANDRLLVMPVGSGVDLVIPDLTGSDAITVSDARFIEMTEVLCPTPEPVTTDCTFVVGGDTARVHALREATLDLVVHPEADPRGERLANLIAETIAWIGQSSARWRLESFSFNGSQARVARRAREFIEEHYAGPVRLEDLCRATRVGVRTLQRSFREYFDLTLTDYLKTVRLQAVHRELLASHPSRDSVSEIASRHGFTHFGRFSADFRERFGELPRQTLAGRQAVLP